MKIDLHTHSVASFDGGINLEGYTKALTKLDYIAITDHNTIDYALSMQQQLGEKIIVGEEIQTTQGEIIGLFLTEKIEPGLSLKTTVNQIKFQGGFVLVPHPVDRHRDSLGLDGMDSIIDRIDAVEALNGRVVRTNEGKIIKWARQHGIAVIAASDAHIKGGLGKTYTDGMDLRINDCESLFASISQAKLVYNRPYISDLLAPKYNQITRNLPSRRHR